MNKLDDVNAPKKWVWEFRAMRFSFELYFWNEDVKSTLLVDPAGQKPNTLNPDLVK